MIAKKYEKKIDPGLHAEIRKEVTDDYKHHNKTATADELHKSVERIRSWFDMNASNSNYEERIRVYTEYIVKTEFKENDLDGDKLLNKEEFKKNYEKNSV